jgi:hypothetical protein
MTRREFVKLLPGTVAAWPLVAQAQQGAPRHIGVLGADPTVWSSWTAAFVTRLQELGWVVGDTIDIEYRWAGGSSKRVSDFTAEFLRRHVDVIVTYGSAAAVLEQAASWHRLSGSLLMSALGQTRTFRWDAVMSALPPKADIAERDRNVRFVPEADIRIASDSVRRANSSSLAIFIVPTRI